MTHYIGLDAHSKTCTFVVVNQAGREVTAQRVPTGEKALVRFVRSLPGTKKLTFEESSLSHWLYGLFASEVEEQVVCNPSYVVRRKGPKSDYLDGLHLAQQLRGNFLTPVVHESSFLFELRAMVSAYQGLVEALAVAKQRLKALCRARAHFVRGTKVYRDEEILKKFSTDTDRFVVRDYVRRIEQMTESKAAYHGQLEKIVRKVPEIRVLKSIPGIGPVRACVIAARVGTPYRFRNKYKFWAYCELVRHAFVSDGETYGRRTIRANRELKSVFLGAAQRAIDKNPIIQTVYTQLIEEGKPHHAAKRNIARRLAAISLVLMKTKSKYNPNVWKGRLHDVSVA
jgi:transposase